MSRGIAGRELDSLAKLCCGLTELALFYQNCPHRTVDVDFLGVEIDGSLEGRCRFSGSILGPEKNAEVEMEPGIVGLKLNGLEERFPGFRHLVLEGKGHAQPVVPFRGIGLEADGLPPGRNGLIQPALPLPHLPKEHVGPHQFGLDGQDLKAVCCHPF